jgi:hypothetical protein
MPARSGAGRRQVGQHGRGQVEVGSNVGVQRVEAVPVVRRRFDSALSQQQGQARDVTADER